MLWCNRARQVWDPESVVALDTQTNDLRQKKPPSLFNSLSSLWWVLWISGDCCDQRDCTYLPHFSHSSTNMFPWSSDNLSLMGKEKQTLQIKHIQLKQMNSTKIRSTLSLCDTCSVFQVFTHGLIPTSFGNFLWELLLQSDLIPENLIERGGGRVI